MPLVLTTDRVNSYGYRMLSSGGQVDEYLKNPILLYDHTRRYGNNEDSIILPIGKVNNLKLANDQWTGDPEFDQDDEFAKKVGRKFEKGYLNAASIGADIIELSNDPELMLPGQTGPTVTKWILREISITDLPSNPDAVKLSYNGNTVCLNGKSDPKEIQDFFSTQTKNTTMKKVIAALNGSKLVTLSEAANEDLVAESVTTLGNQLSAKNDVIAAKDAEIARLTTELSASKTSVLKDKATVLVEAALSAKKIVAEQKEKFVTLASASQEGYDAVKGMLDSMKGYEPVITQLNNNGTPPAGSAKVYATLSAEFTERAAEGTLEALKASNLEHFKQVYKAGTGKEYKD